MSNPHPHNHPAVSVIEEGIASRICPQQDRTNNAYQLARYAVAALQDAGWLKPAVDSPQEAS